MGEAVADWQTQLNVLTGALLPYVCPVTTVLALAYPPSFLWFGPTLWAPGLGALMFAAAVKLRVADFARVALTPGTVALGLAANWVIKPALALLIVRALALDPGAAVGLLMVGVVSPSSLTNYATGVARGSVALAVTLVGLSTVASVALTPALAQTLIGTSVAVSPMGMAQTIVKVIVLPTLLGLLLNESARPVANVVKPFSGVVGLVATALVLGGAVAMHGSILFSQLGAFMVPVAVLFHLAAYAAALWLCTFAGAADEDARAVTLVTGMQSSTMATVLCTNFIPGLPTAIVTTVLSTIVMANSGLMVASFWRSVPVAE